MCFTKIRRMLRLHFWLILTLGLTGLTLSCLTLGRLPAHAEAADAAHNPKPERVSHGPVTFTRDIAPIVFQNCSSCHHPGEVAPFSLLTYQDAQKRARQIAILTESRAMPPWKLVPGYGEFQHERRLTDAQITLFQQWAGAGAPEGNSADLPPIPRFTDGWQIGKPDLILTMPKPFTIPAEGQDVNRSFVVSVHLPAGRYIRAAQFLPGNRRVVHHGTAMLDTSGKARQLEDQQGGPGRGYVSFGGPGFLPSGGLPGYAPGVGAEVYPLDASGILPKDVDVVFGMHYHPDGKEETDQSRIGLYFTDRPPTRIGSLITMGVLNLVIEPGEKAHREKDAYTLPVDVDVESIYEHMHLLGKTCKLWAELPDRTIRPLIQIADWDFSWQSDYHLKNRLHLPKGTVIHADWTYDNSADNPHQFNVPPKQITNGENSTNEMGGVLIKVFVANQQDNGILWIANLGHLWKVSVTPPVHPAPDRKDSSAGLMLLESGIGGLTDLTVSLLQAPLRTIGGLFLLLFVMCLSFLLLPGCLFPTAVTRASDTLTASPLRSFGAGLLALAALLLIARPLLFSPSLAAQIFAGILWAGAFAAWTLGMGTLPRWIDRRLLPRMARRQTGPGMPLAALIRVSVLTTLLFLLPIVGWFLLAPLAMIVSLGAGFSALLSALPLRRPALRRGLPRHWEKAGGILPERPRLLWITLVPVCLLLVGSLAHGATPDPLARAKDEKAVVLLFIASDCPISNSYAPEINRICARYTREKIAFSLVYSDPDLSLAAAKKHAREYGYTCPLILDHAHHLARQAGATVTPEAAVFTPDGKLIYRGRIDNLYVGYGQRRYGATKHDLRDALDAVVHGKPIPTPRTEAIGCFI